MSGTVLVANQSILATSLHILFRRFSNEQETMARPWSSCSSSIWTSACGNRSSRNAASSSSDVKTKAAIVTDTGGVDDKSFNQSAWEGLQAWGKEHNLEKDKGYTYFQSTSEADYANNLQQAAGSYNLIFGVGFALHNAVEEAAKEHTDINYVLIDDVIKDQRMLLA